MHRFLIIILGALLFSSCTYLAFRIRASNAADHDIDAFFKDPRQFRSDGGFQFLDQSEGDADIILRRHREAIANYPYSKAAPHLNLLLNRTEVEVGWHLTIIFSRHGSRWYPKYLDE